jgi:hypothetical protein
MQLPRGLTLAKVLSTFQKGQRDTIQVKSKTKKLKTL